MKRTALNKVLSYAIEIFDDKDKALMWWMTKNERLNNKSPFEICKEGKGHRIMTILSLCEENTNEYKRRTNGFY